ncbi:MAG: Flp family type IVb pilin [Cohaesibacteraceae bacterium]
MKILLSRFAKDESGATAIEYGLIAAGLSIVIIAALNTAGPALGRVWTAISNALSAAAPAA